MSWNADIWGRCFYCGADVMISERTDHAVINGLTACPSCFFKVRRPSS